MSEPAICAVCGEPMPPGEEMFMYHGYSGPCPKPPMASYVGSGAREFLRATTPHPYAGIPGQEDSCLFCSLHESDAVHRLATPRVGRFAGLNATELAALKGALILGKIDSRTAGPDDPCHLCAALYSEVCAATARAEGGQG